MAKRPALAKLAEEENILPSYIDTRGATQVTTDETKVALLAAMGLDASSEAAAKRALSERQAQSEVQLIDPVIVRRFGLREGRRIDASVPAGQRNKILSYRIELQIEGGGRIQYEGRVRSHAYRDTVPLLLPERPDIGYHRLRIEFFGKGVQLKDSSLLVVCPDSCLRFEDLGHDKLFGLWTHLYTVRSGRNWGVGDLSDLDRLVQWADECGAAFVGLNPLHALHNSDGDISPYSPVSRLFNNPLYLDVTAIPELESCPEALDYLESEDARNALAALRRRQHVDYPGVMAIKNRVFELLHRRFSEEHGDGGTRRGRAFADFKERKGDELSDFATFVVLARHMRERGEFEPKTWPVPYRDPRSAQVDAFRREHREEIDRERYLQFELDRQLRRVAETGSTLPIGLYGDLAIGTAGTGADPWAFPGLFLDGVTLGSPPDAYSTEGQDWGFPPVDPRKLKATEYRYWTLLLRSALEHVGALRIDHVMGLFRQYWVPRGRPATSGAYIRFPAAELLGILAVESQRHHAIIVGEDLGTVPRGLPSLLARWGILSSGVMYFQRDRRGGFRSSKSYSKRALVTANTHDHPPLAGFWLGHDLELRNRVGELKGGEELDTARQNREAERLALTRRLRAEGCLSDSGLDISPAELCPAVYRFLSRTPAPLVGVWLDDLAGEIEPLNLPGIGLDRYKSWSRRASSELERLRDDSASAGTLQSLADRFAK